MRDTILGIFLAVIFLGGLFAAAHYAPRGVPPSSSVKSQTVPSIRPQFVGVQRYGVWTLECLKRRQIPAWVQRMMVAQAKSKGVQIPPPGHARICHVVTRLGAVKAKTGWVEVIFNVQPKTHLLAAVLRLSPDLVAPGDYLTLHLSTGDQRVRVLLCGPPECVGVPVIRPQDIPKMKTTQAQLIASSSTMVLSFPAIDGAKARSFSIPTEGLQRAIAGMRKIMLDGRG